MVGKLRAETPISIATEMTICTSPFLYGTKVSLWLWQRWETIKKTRNYCYTVAKNIFVANTHILVLSVSQWFFITLIWDGNRSDEEGGEQLSSHLHNGCLFPATFVFFKVIFSWDQNELPVSWTDLFSFIFFFSFLNNESQWNLKI